MNRVPALLLLCLILVTACAGRQSPMSPTGSRSLDRTSAVTKDQDHKRLYRKFRANGARLAIAYTLPKGQAGDLALQQALDKDFDALYLLFKAAPSAVVRISVSGPATAGVSPRKLASRLARHLQSSCNVPASRFEILAQPSSGARTTARLEVLGAHLARRSGTTQQQPAQATSSLASPVASQETTTDSALTTSAQQTPLASAARQKSGSEQNFILYFNSGRAELDKQMKAQVARLAARLESRPGARAKIEGHSDNVGDPEDNQLLSYQRALAVQIALITDHGLPPERLEVIGRGEAFPKGDNSTTAGRRRNRRVEVRLLPGGNKDALHASSTGAYHASQTETTLPGQTGDLQSPAHVTQTPLPQHQASRNASVKRVSLRVEQTGPGTLPAHSSPASSADTSRNQADARSAAKTPTSAPIPAASRSNHGDSAQRVPAHLQTHTGLPLAETTYAPLSQTPPRYRIEVSISKCTLWLYEIMADGSKRLVRPFQVATAKRGTTWPRGEGRITGIDYSPWWYPTASMKRKARKLGKRLVPVPPGSSRNPMGAVKIMLSHMNNGGAYRIHGTNKPRLIGRRVSLGCIRMRNDDSLELARTVPVGTVVDIRY